MNVNTGKLGEYAELVQEADDATDVAPLPEDLEAVAQKHLREQGRFVDLQGDSELAQFARDHLRRKEKKKVRNRTRRKRAKRTKGQLRRRAG